MTPPQTPEVVRPGSEALSLRHEDATTRRMRLPRLDPLVLGWSPYHTMKTVDNGRKTSVVSGLSGLPSCRDPPPRGSSLHRLRSPVRDVSIHSWTTPTSISTSRSRATQWRER